MYECNLSTFQPFITKNKTKEKSDYGGPKIIFHVFCLYIILTYQKKIIIIIWGPKISTLSNPR